MWEYFDPNPVRSGAIDCTVRAIAKALNVSWEKAHAMLSLNSFLMGSIQNDDAVLGSILRQHGFKRQVVPNYCPDCYTLEMFCEDHPRGTFVVKSPEHVTCIRNGTIYDSWDSSQKTVIFFWYKDEKG